MDSSSSPEHQQAELNPVQRAITFNCPKDLEALLKTGVDVNLRDENDRTLLHLASVWGHSELINILIQNGAIIDSVDEKGRTPLYLASKQGNAEAVFTLVEKGASIENKPTNNVGYSPIHQACRLGHEELVEFFLSKGASIESVAYDEQKPLHCAVEHDSYDVVVQLLKMGANIESRDAFGNTPLILASEYGREELLELLLNNGADIESRNNRKRTPLLAACLRGRKEIVKLLLKKGANVNAMSDYCTCEDDSTCDEIESDLRRRNRKSSLSSSSDSSSNSSSETSPESKEAGGTPLHFAVLFWHSEIVDILLKAGADFEYRDLNGRTPLHCATHIGNFEAIETLVEFGANVECIDNFRKTPLHISSTSNDSYNIMNYFLENGADINNISAEGFSALDYAMGAGRSRRYFEKFLNHLSQVGDEYYNGEYDYESADALQRHIKRMDSAGMHLNVDIIRKSYVCKWSVNDFSLKCTNEVPLLKSTPIGNSKCTLYNFLQKGNRELVSFLRNPAIRDILSDSDSFQDNFPCHKSLIKSHFCKGMYRLKLIREIPPKCYEIFPQLPYECIEMILDYLSRNDLANFNSSLPSN